MNEVYSSLTKQLTVNILDEYDIFVLVFKSLGIRIDG